MERDLVILDSNTLFKDARMRGKPIGQLLALSRRRLIEMAIPAIVLMELERQWRQNDVKHSLAYLRTLSQKYGSALNILGASDAPDISELRIPSLEHAMAQYVTEVASKLEQARVEVLVVPEVPHSAILARDLEGRLPFQVSGKGYRDTLSWESVKIRLEQVRRGATAYLITDDSDFGADGRLDASLAREIAHLQVTLIRVRKIEELLDLEGFQSNLLNVERDLNLSSVNSVETVVKAAALRATEDLFGTEVSSEQAVELGIPEGIEDVYLDVVEVSLDPEWDAYDELDGTTILGEARLTADAYFIGYIRPGNYSLVGDPRIQELVWESDQARVLLNLPARLIFDVRVEKGSETVDTIEYSSIESA